MAHRHNQFVLWGSAGHAKVLADVIHQNNANVIALFDNNATAASCIEGVPLYFGADGFKLWRNKQTSLDYIHAAIAIGGGRGNDRQSLGAYLTSAGLKLPPLVHPRATVSASAHIGDGCHVLANAVVAADAKLGNYCIVNNSANVDHECELGNGVHIAPGAVLCGCVIVGENAMIGAGAIILPHIHIGKDAMVGAGAVVTKNIPERMVVVGNPAIFLGVNND